MKNDPYCEPYIPIQVDDDNSIVLAFKDGIVFAKLIHYVEPTAIDISTLKVNMDEKGISSQSKKSNITLAYKASITLNLINSWKTKCAAFIKGDRKAIDELLINLDLKYNLSKLRLTPANISPFAA